jgi:hypothetical protein
MKPLKISLRIWIALSSLLSFLGGWALFSHSGKPAPLIASPSAPSFNSSDQNAQNAVLLPTLQPLPSLDQLTNSSNNQIQPLQSLPAITNFMVNNSSPRLRTRGS